MDDNNYKAKVQQAEKFGDDFVGRGGVVLAIVGTILATIGLVVLFASNFLVGFILLFFGVGLIIAQVALNRLRVIQNAAICTMMAAEQIRDEMRKRDDNQRDANH